MHSTIGDDILLCAAPAAAASAGARWRGATRFVAILSIALAACGGGGGGGSGGGGGGSPTPLPTLPVATPTPVPAATPTPTEVPSDVSLLLKQGDALPGGINVGDIDDAAVAADGSVAAIVTVSGAAGAEAVVERSPQGDFSVLFGPGNAGQGVDLTTLARPRVAPGGNVLFQLGGDGLDVDRLYLASGGTTQALAGAPPGLVRPDFRALGESFLGPNGEVGFVGGADPCTTTPQNGTLRITCDVRLHVSNGFSVTDVTVPELDLSDQNPSTPQVKILDSGTVYFSVPGKKTMPTLVRLADGKLDVLLTADQEVGSVGPIVRPQLNAVNQAEDLLVTTTLQNDATPRPTVIGVLRGTDFTEIAREGDGTGADQVTALRALGLDPQGRAVYSATLGTADSPGGVRHALRISDGATTSDIAVEGATFPGTDLTLLQIGSARMNGRGDVAFTAELGEVSPGTTMIEEVRAVIRQADGTMRAPITSLDGGQAGTLSSIRIPVIADDGSMLVLAQSQRSGTRVLLLAKPPKKS